MKLFNIPIFLGVVLSFCLIKADEPIAKPVDANLPVAGVQEQIKPVQTQETIATKPEPTIQPVAEPAKEAPAVAKIAEPEKKPAPELIKVVEPEKSKESVAPAEESKKMATLEFPEDTKFEAIQDGHIVQIQDKEDLKKIFKENQYIVMNVFAPWCGHCKRMHKPFAEATKKFEGQVIATKVDVENKKLKEIAGCFDGVPGFFYIRKQIGSTGAEKSALGLTNLSFGQLAGGRIELKDSEIKSKLEKADTKFVKELKSVDEFFKILRENEHVAVKVSAVWCGACKILQKPFRAAAEMYKDKVVACEIDADNKVFAELLDLLGAHSLPTTFYIKKEAGACTPGHLVSAIAMVTGQQPKIESATPKPFHKLREKMQEKMEKMHKKMQRK